MDLLPGKTLGEFLRAESKKDPNKREKMTDLQHEEFWSRLLASLSAEHRSNNGNLSGHCDIKPDNVALQTEKFFSEPVEEEVTLATPIGAAGGLKPEPPGELRSAEPGPPAEDDVPSTTVLDYGLVGECGEYLAGTPGYKPFERSVTLWRNLPPSCKDLSNEGEKRICQTSKMVHQDVYGATATALYAKTASESTEDNVLGAIQIAASGDVKKLSQIAIGEKEAVSKLVEKLPKGNKVVTGELIPAYLQPAYVYAMKAPYNRYDDLRYAAYDTLALIQGGRASLAASSSSATSSAAAPSASAVDGSVLDALTQDALIQRGLSKRARDFLVSRYGWLSKGWSLHKLDGAIATAEKLRMDLITRPREEKRGRLEKLRLTKTGVGKGAKKAELAELEASMRKSYSQEIQEDIMARECVLKEKAVRTAEKMTDEAENIIRTCYNRAPKAPSQVLTEEDREWREKQLEEYNKFAAQCKDQSAKSKVKLLKDRREVLQQRIKEIDKKSKASKQRVRNEVWNVVVKPVVDKIGLVMM